MKRSELAKEYFLQGYNCAQATVLAFSDIINLDKETLLKVSQPFGGGIGRMREVCGTVSGMAIVMGLLYGKEDIDSKAEMYERVQEVCRKFENNNGSIVCRELLGLSVKHEESKPTERTSEFYQKRPCIQLVEMSTEIVEEYINAHPVQ